ncbi:hypothetical protein PSEUDO8BK_60440 [Pseudomonas sp. 8BK]|nr:hypothetical protein PSEUDO8BK_60440 [Pseudomonas sp. 8BK]
MPLLAAFALRALLHWATRRLLMGRLALFATLRIGRPAPVMAGNGGFEHTGGQASRCPPYGSAHW